MRKMLMNELQAAYIPSVREKNKRKRDGKKRILRIGMKMFLYRTLYVWCQFLSVCVGFLGAAFAPLSDTLCHLGVRYHDDCM